MGRRKRNEGGGRCLTAGKQTQGGGRGGSQCTNDCISKMDASQMYLELGF